VNERPNTFLDEAASHGEGKNVDPDRESDRERKA
jgi:hypothetical protein